jgi:hypothetical protein
MSHARADRAKAPGGRAGGSPAPRAKRGRDDESPVEEEAGPRTRRQRLADVAPAQPTGERLAAVSFQNIQGKGVFNPKSLPHYLESMPGVDAHILAERYSGEKFQIPGWTHHAERISQEDTRRSEYINVLAREGVNVTNMTGVDLRTGGRKAVSFDLDKPGFSASFSTMHATYDGNSGTAQQDVHNLLKDSPSDVVMGDANTYGNASPNPGWNLISNHGTSASGAPLDKAFVRRDMTKYDARVRFLDELKDDSEAGTGRAPRAAKSRAERAKFAKPENQPDHRGIAMEFFKPKA